ncbi:hypothetical protein ASE92_00960 [Pedobacter sp. Leaf41]|nr:hypothetical protein ASE92_00960 [Pedobacter sp. Leaf41]
MNLFTYYLKIILPLPILYWCANYTSPSVFVIALFIYALIYRPFIDGLRLVDLGVMSKKETWKMFFIAPYYQLKYFKELYFS